MIRVVEGEPLSVKVRVFVGRHPQRIAGRVLRAVGLALMVGATFVVFATVAAAMAVSPLVVFASVGTSLAGLALIHQGSRLIDHSASGAPQPGAAGPVN